MDGGNSEGSDYDPSADEKNEFDELDTFAFEKAPKKITQNTKKAVNDKPNVIKVEKAKTGRSRCRKCMETIQKGEVRIGMNAWIAGRNAVTWQHPVCFFENISFTRENTGRSKCKYSGDKFQKGDARLSCQSHTAFTNIKLSALSLCLREAVISSPQVVMEKHSPEFWPGYDMLTEEEKEVVTSEWGKCITPENEEPKDVKVEKKAKKFEVKDGMESLKTKKQPEKGQKTKTKGRVAW
eukprot:CAMPEP_0167750938 /NCGR_PEP_ID=MMETSP0110_2-20121227/6274_1 /TAXON_ID=629695 /ORGANISM="Gymnochlora sp., Strain CCMP2014" /LENGTH=237 /DNA_ID=CAMNT_0007636325 /DNA_START=120 /DNA_END=830 /DNA_ORIENTATION=+